MIDEALARLADRIGLDIRWRDAWGGETEADPETIRRLAAALGFDAATAAAVQESLRRLDRQEAAELVPPVLVLREGAALALPFRSEEGGGTLRWRVVTEQGETLSGEVASAHLKNGVIRPQLPPAALPLGYHRLRIEQGDRATDGLLIAAPSRAYLPPSYEQGGRGWGLAIQLYALRSADNWGIGDFSDLAALAEGAGRAGIDALGLNPLNALFPSAPGRVSPYSPSSRRFLNPLYLDLSALPEAAECAEFAAFVESALFQSTLAGLRNAELVDYPNVAGVKHQAVRLLWRSFRDRHLSGPEDAPGAAFRAFQRAGGEALAAFARFQALEAEFGGNWRDWPPAYHDPHAGAVADYADSHRDEVEYVQYLQWQADRQLQRAGQSAAGAGLAAGLYRDLAVGFDPGGADGWIDQEHLIPGTTVGAPPDILNRKGQNWGLAAYAPDALRRSGYAPFIAALRATMRHAGAARIDHVMGLKRLYLVPEGLDARHGVYLRCPFEHLLPIVALESVRQRCLVVGEDLGTVPAGFRETTAEARILSYRLLPFERRHDGGFLAPEDYPELAAASVATHDLATVKGFWLGRDLEWCEKLDLYPDEGTRQAERRDRIHSRYRLLEALTHAGLLSRENAERLLPAHGAPHFRFALAEAAYLYLCRAPSKLLFVQLEDVLEEIEAANLPGTVDEHPNWRRRLSATVAEILADSRFLELAGKLAAQRRQGGGN